uniref:Purple acid phosphatase N-terminal domain-containing protein n=1 Tax=Canis lupus familiaris TaxID=9615 RepID=A0A8C0S2S4_CANLF
MRPLCPCRSCCCLLLFLSLGVQGAPEAAPEQVHLSYPDEPGSMTVTWTTWVPTRSEVQFGLQLTGPLPLRAQGTFSPFVDGGVLRRKFYIHRVTLGLLPGVQYVYRCGSSRGWSRRFRFRALKNGPHWSPRLAVFGDLGADNPKALPRLRRDTQQGMYDAVLHVATSLTTRPASPCQGTPKACGTAGIWALHTSSPSPPRYTSSSTTAATWRDSSTGWRATSRKPIRIGQRGHGSLPWATGPCTVPMLTWMTVRGMKARFAKASVASSTAWRIFSTNTGSTCSCGLTSTHTNGCGPFTTTRYLTAAERRRTPTLEALFTSSPGLLMGRLW